MKNSRKRRNRTVRAVVIMQTYARVMTPTGKHYLGRAGDSILGKPCKTAGEAEGYSGRVKARYRKLLLEKAAREAQDAPPPS